MESQQREFARSTFRGMSKRWRFKPEPKVGPVIAVDRQLEIALRALSGQESTVSGLVRAVDASNTLHGESHTLMRVRAA